MVYYEILRHMLETWAIFVIKSENVFMLWLYTSYSVQLMEVQV